MTAARARLVDRNLGPALALGGSLLACHSDAPATAGVTSSSAATGTSATADVASSSSGGPLPETFVVTGVVTDGQSPLGGAIVMQGGGSPIAITGTDGAFQIELTKGIPGQPTVVAAKVGYRSAGVEIDSYPVSQVTLALFEVHPPDDALGYEYGDPGQGNAQIDNSTKVCGHCHTTYVADFLTSAHAEATRDVLVQDLYAGVAMGLSTPSDCAAAGGAWKTGVVPGQPTVAGSKCYLGLGVLPELNGCGKPGDATCDDPTAPSSTTRFGRCANCHAAGLDGPAGGRNLHEAVSISYEDGNHCDACHHIRDVDMTSPEPGVGGKLVMGRPHDKTNGVQSPVRQAMFGPYPDVPTFFMGGSYQPKFTSSELCSGCHEYDQPALRPGDTVDSTRWPNGVETLSTYQEWSESAYATPGTQCQACHMPPKQGLFNTVDVSDASSAGIVFGFGRAPETMRSHVFLGPLDGAPRLIDAAIVGGVNAIQNGATVDVDVDLENVGAGHAIPTGEPLRSLLLSVRVDGCGKRFDQMSGATIFDAGGAGVRGVVGTDVTIAGSDLTWPSGVALVHVGDAVRIVRPSGIYDDYAGNGRFANPALTPEDKGLELWDPVAEATVVSMTSTTVVLSKVVAAAAGDEVIVGDPLPTTFSDGDPSLALEGAPGYAFVRVMKSSSAERFVPHFMAVDVASDNRLPPAVPVRVHAGFAIPTGCAAAHVTASLLYRPFPISLGRERRWDGRDAVVFSAAADVSLN